MHSFLHFLRVIYVISYLTISENVMCKMSFCEIWHLFSQAPIRNFPLKNVKTNAVCFKLFWYKVFVHWKLKLLKVYTWNVCENIWVFLGVAETIAGSSLCGSVGILQCLFNLFITSFGDGARLQHQETTKIFQGPEIFFLVKSCTPFQRR